MSVPTSVSVMLAALRSALYDQDESALARAVAFNRSSWSPIVGEYIESHDEVAAAYVGRMWPQLGDKRCYRPIALWVRWRAGDELLCCGEIVPGDRQRRTQPTVPEIAASLGLRVLPARPPKPIPLTARDIIAD